MEFLGLCKWCGCPLYRDGPVELDGVWCNHQDSEGREVTRSESVDEERA